MPDITDGIHDDPDEREVRDLYVALSFLDEAALRETPPVSLSDLVAFLRGNLSLSSAQQDHLFSNHWLLSEFHALVRSFSVSRLSRSAQPGREEEERRPGAADIAYFPLRAAASDGKGQRDWIVPGGGGSMHLRDFGENEVLLTILLDRTWAQTPQFYLLEQSTERRVAIISLADPEPSFARGINILRNLENPEHAAQVEMLLSHNSEGHLLQ
jgi:hypothetical protein